MRIITPRQPVSPPTVHIYTHVCTQFARVLSPIVLEAFKEKKQDIFFYRRENAVEEGRRVIIVTSKSQSAGLLAWFPSLVGISHFQLICFVRFSSLFIIVFVFWSIRVHFYMPVLCQAYL